MAIFNVTFERNYALHHVVYVCYQGLILLLCTHFNPSMDNQSHAQQVVEWNYLSVTKILHRCTVEIWEWFNNFIPHYRECDYLSCWAYSESMLVNWVPSMFFFGKIYTYICHIHNTSVTTRRTCYGSCVSGAAAELRLKFWVFCGWLGSESDSAASVPATHVSCSRRASDAPNRTQKIPQRRHVQRSGAVPSRYLQRAFAVPPAMCPYDEVRVCISVVRRRCVEGTTHVRHTHGHILPAQSIYSELITGIPEKFIFNLTKHGENTSVNMVWYPRRNLLLNEIHLNKSFEIFR